MWNMGAVMTIGLGEGGKEGIEDTIMCSVLL
jgi:hypothetical protein